MKTIKTWANPKDMLNEIAGVFATRHPVKRSRIVDTTLWVALNNEEDNGIRIHLVAGNSHKEFGKTRWTAQFKDETQCPPEFNCPRIWLTGPAPSNPQAKRWREYAWTKQMHHKLALIDVLPGLVVNYCNKQYVLQERTDNGWWVKQVGEGVTDSTVRKMPHKTLYECLQSEQDKRGESLFTEKQGDDSLGWAGLSFLEKTDWIDAAINPQRLDPLYEPLVQDFWPVKSTSRMRQAHA